jgi:LemA protein
MVAFIVIAVVLALFLVSIYNGLVRARQQVKEAWSNIDTQLKRRYDLIPNLVETVKGYAKHEAETLEAVIKARNLAMENQSTDAAERAKDENALSGTLKSIFALSENYPDLKSNQNYLNLQQELTDTEDKVQAARSFYNTAVLSLNSKVETFPSNIFAGMFGFKKEAFFELDEAEKKLVQEAPKVSF